MRFTSLLPLLLACAPAQAASYLVLPVDGQGLLPSVRDGIETAVRDGLGQGSVQPRDQTSALLADAAAGGLSCSLDSALCAARIGAIAGVDRVVMTSMRELGAVIGLTLVDTAAQRVIVTAHGPIAPTARDGGASVRAVVQRLAAPPATIDLDVTPNDAEVFLDGVLVGRAPLDAPIAVEAGDHALRVTAVGWVEAKHTLMSTEGANTKLVVALETAPSAAPPVASSAPPPRLPSPPAPLTPAPSPANAASADGPAPLVVASAVTAGAGGVIAVACVIGAVLIESDLNTPKPGTDDPAVINASLALGRGLLVGTGLGLVIAGVGAALFVTATADVTEESR